MSGAIDQLASCHGKNQCFVWFVLPAWARLLAEFRRPAANDSELLYLLLQQTGNQTSLGDHFVPRLQSVGSGIQHHDHQRFQSRGRTHRQSGFGWVSSISDERQR